MENIDKEVENLPLKDELMVQILMHREVHFSGNFDLMIDYYRNDGKGVCYDFTLEDIVKLKELEKKLNQNLAPLFFSGADAELVKSARESYKVLRALYEDHHSNDRFAKLIADLILSEEKKPQKEIEAILKEKQAIIPALIRLVESEEFKNPLFPGYGLAPSFAVECLGLIGDDKAIITLFEQIGREEVFKEEAAIASLKAIGEPAIQFLLKILKGRPVTDDNERAAIAAIHFKDYPLVANACLEMLEDVAVRKHVSFAAYLALGCEGLKDEGKRQKFCALAKESSTPSILEIDFKTVISAWENEKSF